MRLLCSFGRASSAVQTVRRLQPQRCAVRLASHANVNPMTRSGEYVNFYALLGVSRDGTPQEYKEAYYKLAKRFHPDALASLDPATREKRVQHFAQISQAYDTLSNPSKRHFYDVFMDLSAIGDRHRMSHWIKVHRPPPKLEDDR